MSKIAVAPLFIKGEKVSQYHKLNKQKGVSLFVVLVILLLTMLLVLGALRLSGFNESIVGNQADAQRAYAGAEALLRAAEEDIRKNGLECQLATCRFPRDLEDYEDLALKLQGNCSQDAAYKGVCTPSTPNDPKFQTDQIMAGAGGAVGGTGMSLTTAAGYETRFVGRSPSRFATTAKAGSSDLTLSAGKGQYWVEVYVYNSGSSAQFDSTHYPIPDTTYPFIYRITARAEGLKSGTVSILRTYYVPYPRKAIS